MYHDDGNGCKSFPDSLLFSMIQGWTKTWSRVSLSVGLYFSNCCWWITGIKIFYDHTELTLLIKSFAPSEMWLGYLMSTWIYKEMIEYWTTSTLTREILWYVDRWSCASNGGLPTKNSKQSTPRLHKSTCTHEINTCIDALYQP